MERLPARDLESLVFRLREMIYAYCEVKGLKTRLISALLSSDTPAEDGRIRALSGQSLERFGLTNREAEILHLVARGRSNKEIAAELCISPRR